MKGFLAMSGDPLTKKEGILIKILCGEGIGFPLLPLNLPDFLGQVNQKADLLYTNISYMPKGIPPLINVPPT